MSAAQFTAAEIAAALGKQRTHVAALLAKVEPAGVKIVSGREARTWSVERLPDSLAKAMAEQVRENGCADAATYMRQASTPWAPEIPLAECDPKVAEEARKLRDALRPWLEEATGFLSSAEIRVRGVADFKREFGYAISERHWDRLVQRTLRRAGTTHDLDKVELYMPDRLRKAAKPIPSHVPTNDSVRDQLAAFVQTMTDSSAPTLGERDALWVEAFAIHDRLLQAGVPASRAGRQVRAALLEAAPFVAASAASLQKVFQTRLQKYRSAGGDALAIRDQRQESTSIRDIPEADRLVFLNLATQHFRTLSAAWRAAKKAKLLSPETLARFSKGSVSKSYVPAAFRKLITEARILKELGTERPSVGGAWVSRKARTLHTAQQFQSDDFTFPVRWFVPDGKGWFRLVRGQCLIWCDVASWKVIGWSLQPDAGYSSLVIRGGCVRVFEEYCVPSELYFERGIWQRSTLVSGSKAKGLLSQAEVTSGLKSFGLEILHAIDPRSKIVERIGGALQDRMHGEPGYVGREERRDMPLRTKEAIRLVETEQCHPSERFHDFHGWNQRLGEIIADYNAEPQQGRHLDGLSPNQAFAEFKQPGFKPITLEPGLRWYLSHQQEKRVQKDGITFTVGKQQFRYYGPELAPYVGQTVLAGFDTLNPSFLSVLDLNRKNPIVVPLHTEVHPRAQTPEDRAEFQAEKARAAGHMSHMRALYNTVKNSDPFERRPLVLSPESVETHRRLGELHQKAEEKKRTLSRGKRVARDAGLVVSEEVLADPSRAAALDVIRQFRKEQAKES